MQNKPIGVEEACGVVAAIILKNIGNDFEPLLLRLVDQESDSESKLRDVPGLVNNLNQKITSLMNKKRDLFGAEFHMVKVPQTIFLHKTQKELDEIAKKLQALKRAEVEVQDSSLEGIAQHVKSLKTECETLLQGGIGPSASRKWSVHVVAVVVGIVSTLTVNGIWHQFIKHDEKLKQAHQDAIMVKNLVENCNERINQCIEYSDMLSRRQRNNSVHSGYVSRCWRQNYPPS